MIKESLFKFLILLLISLFALACAETTSDPLAREFQENESGAVDESENDEVQVEDEPLNFELNYSKEVYQIKIGTFFSMLPTIENPNGYSFSCHLKEEVELSHLSFDPNTCGLSGITTKSFEITKFEVITMVSDESLTSSFKVEAPKLLEVDFPEAAISAPVSKYYMSTLLQDDPNFMATFDARGIHFFDLTNPFDPDTIEFINILNLSGMPQALVSLGEYIYITTTTGRFHVFDWSSRNHPIHINTFVLSVGGQMYDIASNEENLLFLANTSHHRLLIVDVTDPLAPQEIFVSQRLSSFASGVAYYEGIVYVADFSGQIHLFGETPSNSWELISSFSTVQNPARLSVSENKLIAHRYGAGNFHVYNLNNDKSAPQLISSLIAPEGINIYSRSFFIDDKLFIGSQDQASLEVYQLKDNLIEHFHTHEFESTDIQANTVLGIMPFRNQSFISMIVRQEDNGDKRHLIHLPLEDIVSKP